MIIMIVSLTLDGGKSITAQICRSDIAKFLGKISLSLYLIHLPILQYFCVIIQAISPELLELTDYRSMLDGGTMPWFGIFFMVPFSIVTACALEYFLETPCRDLLRSKKQVCYQDINTNSTEDELQSMLRMKISRNKNKS